MKSNRIDAKKNTDKLTNNPYVKVVTTDDMLEELKMDKDKQLVNMIRSYLSDNK